MEYVQIQPRKMHHLLSWTYRLYLKKNVEMKVPYISVHLNLPNSSESDRVNILYLLSMV